MHLSRKQMGLEMIALLVIPPALVWAQWLHMRELYPVVMVIALALYYLTRKKERPPLLQSPPKTSEASQLRYLIKRYLLCILVLISAVAFFEPNWLFSFPKEKPQLWLFVMFFYPFLSAVSQELLYRWLFFNRWGWIFKARKEALAVNTLAFAWLHIFFPWPHGIPVGFLLCIPAGWFLAQTYYDTRSFRLVWLEHALYGNTIFTIGLGKAFYLPIH